MMIIATAAVFTVTQAACVVPLDVTRTGDAVALPSGAPQSECEERGWLEVAPTSASAYDQRGYMGPHTTTITTVSSSRQGVGVYRYGGFEPLYSGEVFEHIDAPALRAAHMGRVLKTRRRYRAASGFLYGGLAGVLVGTGMFLVPVFNAFEETPLNDAMLYGGGGMMIGGLAVMLVSLVLLPSPNEMNRYHQRQYVFYKYEDDLEALGEGVSRHNEGVREACRGR